MKNLINYLSKKSLSLGNGPALDRRWTGHESGRFLSILTLFLMLFSFGVGNVWGAVTALTIPKAWGTSDGKSAYTEALGCSNTSCLGSDYSSAPKLKFDGQGDYIIIQIASAPAYVTFNIKGNPGSGSWSGTFKVQESSNGSTYTDAASYTSLSSSSTSKTVSLSSATRYIKFNFVTKSNGNVGLGGVTIKARTSVTLDKNGGDADGSAVFAHNATAYESFTTVTRTGYTLNGYYTASSAGTKVLNADGSRASSSISGWWSSNKWAKDAATAKLYAQWSAKTYGITLDRNGASSGSTSVTMTYNSSSHTAITAPTRDGYTFDGWYDSESNNNGTGNQIMNASGVLQANAGTYTGAGGIWILDDEVTLYAKWAAASSCGTPTVGAPSNGSVSVNTATVSCTGITKNDCDIEEWGFYYKTGSSGVTTSDTKHQVSAASSSTSVGSYSWDMTSLSANTHYYVKAYAIVDGVTTLSSSETDFTTCKVAAPNHVDITPTAEAGNYGYRYTIGETIKLTATAYSSAGTGSPIAAANITGYQWQKYVGNEWENLTNGTTDGVTISGATTANLSISNCKSSNTGSYACVIRTGASCSTASDGYRVRVYTLDGAYYGDDDTKNAIVWTSETTGTVTLSLNASKTYMFKVTDNDGKWYGREANNFIIEPWQQNCNTENQKIRLFTGPAGNYTFTIDITNAQAGTPVVNVKVEYPDVSHPIAGYVYIDKWWDCYVHYWYDGSNKLTNWGSDPQITRYTTICGNDYWYFPVLDYYANFIAKNNAGDATSSNTTGDQSTTSHSGQNITNHGSGWGWEAFPAYTISFDKGAGSGTMSSITDITGGANQLLPANSFTKTGYDFDGWIADVDVKISESTVTEGTKFSGGVTLQEICGDVALTAQWVANSYDVTLKKNGGAAAADQVVSATYDSDMPLVVKTAGTDIVVPSRNGYTFQGYWDTSESSGGTQYYSYSGTPAVLASARVWDKTSATNLYGRWQANVYTVTLDNQSATTAGAASVSATFGQAMPSIASNLPAKTGYRFDGYYTDKNGGGTKYYNADGSSATNMAMYSANPKLYANWVAQLTFSVNGVIDDELTRDVTEDLPSSADVPTACGDCWEFAGWDANSTCSTTPGHAGGENAATHGITTPTTLYAVFGMAEYELIRATSDLEADAYYVLTTLDIDGYEYALKAVLSGNYGTSTDIASQIKEKNSWYYLYNPSSNLVWKFTGNSSSGRLYSESLSKYMDLTGSGSLYKDATSDYLSFSIPDPTYVEFNIASTTTTTQKLHIYNDTEWGPTSSATGIYIYKRQSATYATEPSCETYDIVWNVDGTPLSTGSQTEETNTCAGIEELPTNPAHNTLECADSFMGWSETELIGEGHDEPADLFTSVESAPAIDEDKTFHAVFATEKTSTRGSYTITSSETNLSDAGDSGDWGTYGKAYEYTADDGSSWVVKAYRTGANAMQINTGKNSSIKIPDCPTGSFIKSIVVTCTGTNALGFSDYDYEGSGTINYVAVGSSSTSQTLDLVGKKRTGGYIVPHTNSCAITSIVVNYVQYENYMTTCCNHIVTLSDGSPSNGSVTFDPVGPIETCTAAKEVSMTITPDPGYYLSAWTSSGVTPSSVEPPVVTNTADAQTTTVTFAKETTEGTYTAGATFSAKALEGWTWMYKKDADIADGSVDPYAIPDVVEIYKDQYARFIITGYTPVDVIAAKQGYVYSAGGVEPAYSTDYLTYVSKNGSEPYSYYQLKGKAPTESTTITFKAVGDASITKTITIRVKALPLAHFVDNVHNVAFDDVVATVTTGVVTLTKQTPTHADFTGSTANTCEETHLHLVGWIDGDWTPYAAYMAGTGDKPTISAITGATGYFYAPGADIDLVAKDGKTYYAVWANVE